MTDATAPDGYNTINPFIITRDALNLIAFLTEVFEAEEDMSGRTMDTDGLLLHSELIIGGSRVMVADRKPGWPYTPSLLQIYVASVEEVLTKAERLGSEVVTKPTDFFGTVLFRLKDPFGNLWWVYQHNPGVATGEDLSVAEDDGAAGKSWAADDQQSWEPSEELVYVHDTLLKAMEGLRE